MENDELDPVTRRLWDEFLQKHGGQVQFTSGDWESGIELSPQFRESDSPARDLPQKTFPEGTPVKNVPKEHPITSGQFSREYFGRGQWGPREWGMGPKNYQRPDERILEDACEKLTWHNGIDAREIQVSVQTGIVTLKGRVLDRETKVEAERAIEHIWGVRDVQNLLEFPLDEMK
jgi:hypothetical protein